MRKYLYLSAVCVCMALCFVGCSKDDDEPGGKGAMYEVTIEQSGDFRSFIKSVVVVANGTRLKDGATGESLASPLILSDEELAVEKVTLTTTGKAIEFAVSGSVVDGEDGVVNEPMQWVLEGEPNVFRLYLKNRSGSMSVLEQDVSDQVHDVPVAGHIGDVHLVLNFDYEVPSEPGSGGPGFDVDVDDWDDVNVDIVL